MTETKVTHTPGPWYTQGTAGHEKHGQSVVYADTGTDIAIVYDGVRNANLIAAAPEMLEALERIRDYFEMYGTPNDEIGGVISAIINKAKGEE